MYHIGDHTSDPSEIGEKSTAQTTDVPPPRRVQKNLTGLSRARPLQFFDDSTYSTPVHTREDYTIAWICALPTPEWSASRWLFDTIHTDLPLPPHVQHQYAYGTINKHNVVMGCLPAERLGEISAALVLNEMLSTFPNISFALMVGIGGGVWSEQHDVRLGDVVVSYPSKDLNHGGVVEYEYGKILQDQGFKQMSSLNMPQINVLAGLSKVKSSPPGQSEFENYLESFELNLDRHTRTPLFARPSEPDVLFKSGCLHDTGKSDCSDCNDADAVLRAPRQTEVPFVHYGLVASGKRVIKDAVDRDRIWNDFDRQVLCFEMEAAGVVNQAKTCLVVRGICDYCDSHKNKKWQPYAAAAAASWAKEYLRNIAPIIRCSETSAKKTGNHGTMIRYQNNQLVRTRVTEQDFLETIERLSTYDPLVTLRRLKHRRVQGTTGWLEHNKVFLEWLEPVTEVSKELLICGIVGGGKTLVMQRAIELVLEPLPLNPESLVLHWFCQHPHYQASDAIRSFAKQIIQHYQNLGKELPTNAADELSKYFGQSNRTATALEIADFVIGPLLSSITDLTLCVDGIDEFSVEEREKLRKCLSTILSKKAGRLIMTTQDVDTPRQVDSDHFRIRLQSDAIAQDIEIFIDDRLRSLASTGSILADQTLHSTIRSSLLAQAEGMFLWVKLVLDLLEDCENAKQMMQSLQDVPHGIEEIYIRCLNKKKKGHYVCKPEMLRHIAVASEPLTVKQVQELLAIDRDTGMHSLEDEMSITSIYRAGVGLISLDEHDGTIAPVHRSVRQFLFSGALQQSLRNQAIASDSPFHTTLYASWDEHAAILELAQLSIAHINHCTTGELVLRQAAQTPQVLGMIPRPIKKVFRFHTKKSIDTTIRSKRTQQHTLRTDFLSWAIRTWPCHTRVISSADTLYATFCELALHLNKTENVFPWCKSMPATLNSHIHNMLGYAVAQDHVPLLQLIMENLSILPKGILDLPLNGNDLMLPMHLACQMGFEQIALELAVRCNPDARCQQTGRTAWHYAAEGGNESLLSHLLEIPVAARWRSMKGSAWWKSWIRHVDSTGMTPLHVAAAMGQTSALRVFYRCGVFDEIGLDHKQLESGMGTMLTLAARHGHTKTVRFLLNISSPAMVKQGHIALYEALIKTSRRMAFEILQSSQMPSYNMDTCVSIHKCLILAIKLGYQEIVEHLLENYADEAAALVREGPDYAAKAYAFYAALDAGGLDVIKVLAPYADPNSSTPYSSHIPLLHAISMRRADIFEFLLTMTGIETHSMTQPDVPPPSGRPGTTAWTLAIAVVHADATYLRLLLQHEREHRTSSGYRHGVASALTVAAAANESEIVDLLLRTYSRVSTSLVDHELGRTPLSWAVTQFDDGIIRRLLDAHDVDINAKDDSGRTALSWAAQHGRLEVVEMLLASGQLEPDERDEENATTLARAVIANRHDVVKALLRKAELMIVDEVVYLEWTALSWAAAHCNFEMVDLFCRFPIIDVSVPGLLTGRSALSRAAERGLPQLVLHIRDAVRHKILFMTPRWSMRQMEGEVDVTGCSPLLYAISSGNLTSVQYLIPEPGASMFHPHWKSGHALRWAAMVGTVEIVEELMNRTPLLAGSRDDNGMTALNLAVKNRRGDLANYLLSRSESAAVVSEVDDDGHGILYWSVMADLDAHLPALLQLLDLKIYREQGETMRLMHAKYGLQSGKVGRWISDYLI